jgi:hypothetical protein
MAYPSVTFRDILSASTLQELDQLCSLLQGYLSSQHKADGSHSAVTADTVTATSMTTTGDLSVGDDLAVADHFSHSGLLTQNSTTDVSVSTSATTWGNGGPELAFEMNLRVTSAGGLGPRLDGAVAAATHGTVYRVFNASGTTFTVKHESALANAAGDRILCPGSRDYTVRENGSFVLVRDASSSRWRLIGGAVTYEEGTWTPALKFGGASTGLTYSTQTGTYTRVGNVVTIEGRLVLSAKGSSTGSATITGCPFTAANNPSGLVDAAAALAGLTGAPYAVISTTTLNLVQTAAAARTLLDDTHFTNTSDLRFSLTYQV